MSVPQVPQGSVLRAAVAAPSVGIETIAPVGTVLILSPHPDDETFGCGMAMAAAAARGRRIVIVLLTDGEASHPNSQSYTREQLVALRSDELANALDILVPTADVDVVRLHSADGKSCYDRVLSERVIGIARTWMPATVWTTWRGDPHCDHQAAHALARELADSLEIPLWTFAVWGRFGERDVPQRLMTFYDPLMVSRKKDAIAAYSSQIDPRMMDDPTGFAMPPALVSHFADHPEVFFHD